MKEQSLRELYQMTQVDLFASGAYTGLGATIAGAGYYFQPEWGALSYIPMSLGSLIGFYGMVSQTAALVTGIQAKRMLDDIVQNNNG